MATKKSKPSNQKRTSAKRSRSTGTRTRARRSASKPALTLDEWLVQKAAPWQREILGVALVLFGALTILVLAPLPLGPAGATWARWLRLGFGWGSWVIALSVVFAGLHLALRTVGRPWKIGPRQVIGFEILFVASLALTHVSSATNEEVALTLAAAGRGGGYVGWALAIPLVDGLGFLTSWLVLVVMWLIGAALLFQVERQDIQAWFLRLSAGMRDWAERIQQHEGRPETMPPARQSGARPKPAAQKPARQLPLPQPQNRTDPAELVIARPALVTSRTPSRPSHLPPMDLLEASQPFEQNEAEIREKATIIEDTLLDFGLPVRVIEVRRGPTVTQFGIAPQYIEKPAANGEVREQKVRVNQITSLTNDLALALAATHIRMEAPVPGRPIVGIEVPNKDIALVHLRSVLASEQFHKKPSPLTIGLGLDVSGTPVVADLSSMPHLLIAGTTGAGKSVCINAITACLVYNNRPEDLSLVMIDPKMVELVRFNGLPHLLGKVEVELERIIGVLRWLTAEMDERYKVLAEVGARNLTDYNKLAGRRKKLDKLPYIVLMIDELADLMMMAPEEVETTLVRLAQMARAVGIHLVVATQRPSTDVVTGLIKANFPARIAFAVATSTNSRVILDSVGADSLLGRGDMLFQAPDAAKPVRLQGCFVSDLEIERVVSFWRHQLKGEGDQPTVPAPWDDLLARREVVRAKDDLLEKAIELAKQNETISTSYIQRRLRIGYPRAARLMEALEDLGVVGEEQAGGRTRDVLVAGDDDPLGNYIQNGSDGIDTDI